ncbi:MAG: extracellular solute-binding protein [Candidatus Hydrogenedentes bacterium]|nr:extracellular solute-binding protein [Candidatus Hydrogenedentota bacterium]
MREYLWYIVCAVACLVVLVVLWPSEAGSPEEKAALAEGRVVITYWDRHTGHEYEARVKLIEEFNRSQNQVYVRTLPIGSRIEKLLTAIAGGAPPEICSLETAVLAALASQGCFTPLEDFMAAEPYLNEEKFFPHVWAMVRFDGHVWAVPTTTDSTCLLWNKGAFRRAGLDPDRPPRTLNELEEYAAKLTVRSPNGMVEQIGFLPWLPWDVTHMWGCLFGGKWYDPATKRVVCGNDPGIIASLAWQQTFAVNPASRENPPHAIDPTMVSAIPGGGFGEYQSASNPFYTGKVAMITEGEWQVEFTRKYAPDLDWGVAPIPQPEGAPPVAYSPNAVVDAIPVGSKNEEAAKVFLRWFYSPRPNGGASPASDYNYDIQNIPPRREEAMQERFTGHPKFRVFVEQLLTKPAEPYPAIPAMQLMSDDMERQRGYVTLYKITPEDAAHNIEADTNTELERVAKVRGRAAR